MSAWGQIRSAGDVGQVSGLPESGRDCDLCVAMHARDEQEQSKPYGIVHKHPNRREDGNP